MKSAHTLGQKLARIDALVPSPRLSEESIARVSEIADCCAKQVAIRNDLVHSRLQLVEIEGAQYACLINTEQPRNGNMTARLITLPALHGLAKEIEGYAFALRQA